MAVVVNIRKISVRENIRKTFECDLLYFSDVTGVEIVGVLKNVLPIAPGIVEGMDLGNNCMASSSRLFRNACVWLPITNRSRLVQMIL